MQITQPMTSLCIMSIFWIADIVAYDNNETMKSRKELKKFYKRYYIVVLNDLCNTINSWKKIRFTGTLTLG